MKHTLAPSLLVLALSGCATDSAEQFTNPPVETNEMVRYQEPVDVNLDGLDVNGEPFDAKTVRYSNPMVFPEIDFGNGHRLIDNCEGFEAGPNHPYKCAPPKHHSENTYKYACWALGWRTWHRGNKRDESVRDVWMMGFQDYTPFYFARHHRGGSVISYLQCRSQ